MLQSSLLIFLVRDPNTGYLVVTPSNSPENSPSIWRGKANLFAGITMDNQLVSDLFSNTRAAAQVLNLDKQFCDTILSLKRQLPPMQVGQYGQLQEWFEDWDNLMIITVISLTYGDFSLVIKFRLIRHLCSLRLPEIH